MWVLDFLMLMRLTRHHLLHCLEIENNFKGDMTFTKNILTGPNGNEMNVQAKMHKNKYL